MLNGPIPCAPTAGSSGLTLRVEKLLEVTIDVENQEFITIPGGETYTQDGQHLKVMVAGDDWSIDKDYSEFSDTQIQVCVKVPAGTLVKFWIFD